MIDDNDWMNSNQWQELLWPREAHCRSSLPATQAAHMPKDIVGYKLKNPALPSTPEQNTS